MDMYIMDGGSVWEQSSTSQLEHIIIIIIIMLWHCSDVMDMQWCLTPIKCCIIIIIIIKKKKAHNIQQHQQQSLTHTIL